MLTSTHHIFDEVNTLTEELRNKPEEQVLMRILESHAKTSKVIAVTE